jgi:predicted flap endonuclease-1-like 5' DNA nuclease
LGRKENSEDPARSDVPGTPRTSQVSHAAPKRDSHSSGTRGNSVAIHEAPPQTRPAALSAFDTDKPDDLTRIRRIKQALGEKLHRMGITRFEQIADWSSQDIKSLTAALDLGFTIYQQNWIEQAAQLVLRRQRDKNTSAAPAPTEPAGKREVPSAPEAEAPASANHPAEGFAPPRPRSQLSISRQIDQNEVARQISAAAVAIKKRLNEVAAVGASDEPQVAPPSFDEVATEAEPVTPHANSDEAKADNLRLIDDLPQHVAERLMALGVTRFAGVAAFDADDIATLSIDCALGERVNREGWVEQAAILASNRPTKASQRYLRGEVNWLVPYPAPAPERDPFLLDALSKSPEPAPEVPLASAKPSLTVGEQFPQAPAAQVEVDASQLDSDDLASESLFASEAEVRISPKGAAALKRDHSLQSRVSQLSAKTGEPAASTILEADPSRTDNAPDVPDIDERGYAGYQTRIEEASVDIVPAGHLRGPSRNLATNDGEPNEETKVGRFLKALRGR